MKKTLLLWLLVAAICPSTVACLAADRPNVLFIAVDDLRPSIGCYGDPHAITPHLDRLASRGVRFNRAYCQVAVCNPSRASLMTGRRPDNLGVWTLPIHFREAMPDAVTLPQWFRRFGYTAVSHGKIYHNPTPDPQSWSEPIRDLGPLPFPYPEAARERVRAAKEALPADDWRKRSLRMPSTAAPELEDSQVLDGARTDLAIEDLRRLGAADAPFFLAMGYIRPHLAWVAPKKYWDLHDPDRLPVLENERVTPGTPPYALANNSELTHYVDLIDFPKPWDEHTLPVAKARHLMHGYYACVSYVDAQIGRLLDALDEEGLADNTIVVLWSDHGWKLGEHRGWGKMTNYEIDARVPLLIAVPGTPNAGRASDQLVELLDLFPTLCDLAGLSTPAFCDGRSLTPLLQNPGAAVHTAAISQYYRRFKGREYMGYALRTATHRFVEWRDFHTGEVTDRELYDHRDEHSEASNLIDSASAEQIDRLTAELLESHPRRGLVLTPLIHSKSGRDRPEARIVFENRLESGVAISRILPKGGRARPPLRLRSAQTKTIPAREGDVFVVESRDGRLHEVHTATAPSTTVLLKTPGSESL